MCSNKSNNASLERLGVNVEKYIEQAKEYYSKMMMSEELYKALNIE